MPPLSQALRKETPEGYAAREELPEPAKTPALPTLPPQGANPFIRSPLPGFNISPDALRQFNENIKVPVRRVIPLPTQTTQNGSLTIVNNTIVSPQAGGGGGGNAPITVNVKTVTIDAGTLLPGDIAVLDATTSKIAVLMIVGSSDECEVRIYGDAGSQSADVPRQTDTAPAFEVTQGLVTDVVLDTPPLQWNWQNRLFVNQDSPQSNAMYISVLNPTAGAVTPSVTITYLPLE
jgi:hypothetical protein